MAKTHSYAATVTWTGNHGVGTRTYRAYSRAHEISGTGKPKIPGSSDPSFRGDASRWNPEELLVAALSQCHMLWYLHLCTEADVVVTSYVDKPQGVMLEAPDGGGQFTEVVLRPRVVVTTANMVEQATELHAHANKLCFIARSMNFPVHHEPTVIVERP